MICFLIFRFGVRQNLKDTLPVYQGQVILHVSDPIRPLTALRAAHALHGTAS